MQEAQPKAWEALAKSHGAAAEVMLLDRIRHQIDQRGTLDVLRHGIDMIGNRPPRCATDELRAADGCSTCARRRINRKDSGSDWMKVRWQVSRG